MSSDIHAKVDTSRKIRFTKKEPDDRTEWVEREVNIDESAEDVAEEGMVSLPQGEDQQVHSSPAANKSPARSAKLSKMVLWILMLGVIIILAIYIPLEIVEMKKSISHLQAKLLANNSHLQATLLGKWCPDGWKRFGSNCYFKYEDTKSWYESRIHCQDKGADLVIINSPDEQEFVKQLNEHGESWIGLKGTLIRATGKYEWRWVDGSPLTQTIWAEGWPWGDSRMGYATCCNDEGEWTHIYSSKNAEGWICEK